MTVYVFSGWPEVQDEDQEPATFLNIEAGKICNLETDLNVSEALPDCKERLVLADEVVKIGLDIQSFPPTHVFGNGVSCAYIRPTGFSDPIQLSWIVTPKNANKLSTENYKLLKDLI